MPQIQLPIFPEGVTHITALLAFSKQDGRVTYFNGSMPVFVHDEEDVASFRMITAQFCVNGKAEQADIVHAFGVTKISLKRAVKRYREEGPKGFYKPRKRRGPAVLTADVLAEAQPLLDEGLEPSEVADRLGIKRDTVRKKIQLLAQEDAPGQWSAALCERWMAGVLYIDGHVRVYNGSQTRLPRHYVARQRLCLRATTDYWANAMDGQPFFVVNQVVDPGMIQVIENEIVPRLEQRLPAQADTAQLKAKRTETPHHVTVDELPEEARFRQLRTHSKQLVDTIKMIAYRAETAMANSLREHLKRPDEARRLLRALYTTEADLLPDPEAGTLTVRLHHGANGATDQLIEKLCAELSATTTIFPRTNLRLVLKLRST